MSYAAIDDELDQSKPFTATGARDSEDSLRNLELSDGPAPLRTRGRSYSISGFDFRNDLLPLSSSVTDPEIQPQGGSEKSISVWNGIALCVGLQIGSGIFSSPGVVVANTNSVGASLIVWMVAGVLAWTGASSFAELGSAIPENGGAQAYLAYAYGPLLSYLYAWTAIIALKPGGNAVISLIFAEYILRIFKHTTKENVSPDDVSGWAIHLTAIGAVCVVSAMCIWTRQLGARAAVIFTTVKVRCYYDASMKALTTVHRLPLWCVPSSSFITRYMRSSFQLFIAILGIVQLARGNMSTSFTGPLFEGSSHSPSAYSLALYSGLWAFDGWDQANYVAGEMHNPSKSIPRTIHSSMAIVMVLFLLANVSYFVVLDKDTVGRSNTVAMDFGRALFGPIGGTIFACMVAFSCFGALNGAFFTTSRLIYAAGRERYLPSFFGRLHSTRKTPLNATLLQTAITSAFILMGGGFRSLINFSVVASWGFYFLSVLGLVILRVKEPALERPYKTWITTPLIFCGVALFLIFMPVVAAPLQGLAVLGFVLAGVPVYYVTHRADRETPRVLAWIQPFWARIRGRPHAGEGWQSVATEGDEQVEMLDNRAHR